jgi:hypothetical protein
MIIFEAEVEGYDLGLNFNLNLKDTFKYHFISKFYG